MAGGQLHLLSPGPVMEPPETRPQLATYSGDRSLGAAYVSLCELEVALRTIRTLWGKVLFQHCGLQKGISAGGKSS